MNEMKIMMIGRKKNRISRAFRNDEREKERQWKEIPLEYLETIKKLSYVQAFPHTICSKLSLQPKCKLTSAKIAHF